MGLGTCRSTLLSVSIYVIVAVAGAVVIMFMEREGMKRTANKDEQRPGNTSASPNNSKNLTMHAREYLENHASLSWSLDDTEKLIKDIKGFGSKSRQLAENDNHGWRKQLSLDTFSTWMYFAVCTTSTIGYGDITPISNGGKILAILLIVIGVPANIYMFACVAAFLTRCMARLKNLVASKCRNKSSCKPDMLCFFLCIIILLLYVGGGGIAVGFSEGWKWYDGLYWSFSSAATVGYGDIIPKSRAKFTFAFFSVIIMIMPVYAIHQALQHEDEVVKEDRLMAKAEDV